MPQVTEPAVREGGEAIASVVARLERRLDEAVARAVSGHERAVVLFSGGIDSALLAHQLRGRLRIELRTIGLPGAPDLEDGRSAAALLGLPWVGIGLTEAELTRAWRSSQPELGSLPEPRRSVLFALALGFEHAAGEAVVLGQGADELFGGYRHFEGLEAPAAGTRAELDLAQLRDRDWPATRRLAEARSVQLCAPFLDPEFVGAVVGLPPEIRFPPGPRKLLLRRVAELAGLPAPIVARPKRALQYGTRIARWLRSQDPCGPG